MSDKKTLTFEQLMKGGDEPLQELEIQGLLVGGETGVVWVKQLDADVVLDFAEAQKKHIETKQAAALANRAAPEDKTREQMMNLIQQAIVNKEGQPIFTVEKLDKLGKVSIGVFNQFAQAVRAMAEGATAGKESGAANGSASPLN